MKGMEDLPPLREVIAKHGLYARRRLGQNFLFDVNLTDKIVRKAGTIVGHDILEIGPGPGGLTRSLVSAGARRVVAIEKDRRFLPALHEIEDAASGILSVVHADAMDIDPSSIVSPPAKIISNLPYNAATTLLAGWLSVANWPPPWISLVLAFQREVAERLIAGPGTKSYGRMSILAQWRTSASIVMTIPPSAFVPVPKVTTAIVRFDALPAPIHDAEPHLMLLVAKTAFSQRRKMLRTSLKPLGGNIEAMLAAAGISPEARADALSISDYCAIARELGKVDLPD